MRQMAASNQSEVPIRLACLGERARQCNALDLDAAGQYGERARRDTLFPCPKRSLPVLGGKRGEVRFDGGNDTSLKLEETSDYLIVAMKLADGSGVRRQPTRGWGR